MVVGVAAGKADTLLQYCSTLIFLQNSSKEVGECLCWLLNFLELTTESVVVKIWNEGDSESMRLRCKKG